MAPTLVDEDLDRIRAALDRTVPAKTASNLLIGTWNVRGFGDITDKWLADPDDSPKRDWHAVACIAEVVRRFDVVAVQEVRRDTSGLHFLLDRLGAEWRVIASDVTEGSAGNGERLSYVYDGTRVEPSGLVGEIVLPPIGVDPTRQFARTPYAASFRRDDVEFILTSVHVIWGKNKAERLPEISAFAAWMREWAERKDDWNRNLLVLGDFNIDRLDDPLFVPFVEHGLWPPTGLENVPRTIFDNDKNRHFYDQIAWFSENDASNQSLLSGLTFTQRCGHFDFRPHVFRDLTQSQLSWRMSDHYPLWVEFAL